MSRHKFLYLAVLIAAISAGCCFHTDLTRTPDVQQSGILGQQFRTTQDVLLLKDKHVRTLFMATRDYRFSDGGNRDKQIGVLEAGTTLQVNQAVRVKELIAILVVLPEYYTWNCTLARVEDGPYAGKEVAIAGNGIWYNGGAVVLGSSLLRPVNQAAMISALYKMHSYSPPAPAKYDFYDSKSNLFATVTLIRPVPSFPIRQFDGMWLGSLAKSYVRPKSQYVLASDKLNVHDLHRFTGQPDFQSRAWAGVIDLNPDEPAGHILLFMPTSETNGPVRGWWTYETDARTVEAGTFAGPVR